jgi:TetR/AcrR family transcriptional regulator, regulator of cefoperazone and chloramphenicol sensitivity
MTQSTPDNDHQQPGTRERLLDAAERLFAARGFAGTSVREIAEEAGTNLGAINYHFRSKENLYAEVFSRRIARMREEFLGPLQSDSNLTGGDLEAALSAFGKAFLAAKGMDPADRQRGRDLCARELIEAQLPPGLFNRELVAPLIELISGTVRRARPELEEETARSCARSFFAQILHIQMLRMAKRARAAAGEDTALVDVEEQLAHIVRFTTTAIRHI